MSGIWEEDPEGQPGDVIDPIAKAFRELPPLVAGQLDAVEREMLSSQAHFAAIGEQAGGSIR